MKKKFFGLMVTVMLMVFPVLVSAEEAKIENFLKVGDTEYNAFVSDEENEIVGALEKVKELHANGQETVTIEVTRDAKNVPGFSIAQDAGYNLVIDLKGHTLELGKPLFGSAGTVSQNFQIKKGSTIVFKNGTLKADPEAKMLIQNYSNLTLENITIDATTMTFEGTTYAVSSNCGKLDIKGETNIYSNSIALDVYWWNKFSSGIYANGTQVTLNTTGTVKGEILVSAAENSTFEDVKTTLTIENVNHEGVLNIQDELKNKVTIKGGTYDDEKIESTITPPKGSEVYKVETPENETKYVIATEKEVENLPYETEDTITTEELKEEIEILKKELEEVNEEELTEEELKEYQEMKKMIQLLEGKTIISIHNLFYGSFIDGNYVIDSNQSELKEAVEVTLALPEDLAKVKEGYTRKYYVLRSHINENGEIEFDELPATEKDGKVTFKTDKFSSYILTYKDVEDAKPAKTYDGSISYILFATVSLIALIAIGGYAKNRKAFN